MIARTFPCDSNRLADLLADRLPEDQSRALTVHLERCASCRRQLEALAGEGQEWADAREALSACDLGAPAYPATAAVGSTDELASEIPWVRSLLEPCETGGLGRLGRFPIRGVIGQGGMGVVLSAWDDELNRPLALKLLTPHLASSGAARQRFLREAQAAAAVVHPNVVPIYSINADARLPYLVMPYIAGGNLQQRIDREGPLELEDCLRIGLQIAEGLAAAHRQGLIHRDIKPANILLEEGGHRILISDFGLARALDDVSMTASGVIAGTPPYMSPEQARGDTAQYRSDLFSLGSVLYAMATARPPFRGETALAVLRQIGEQRVTPIREINERMPVWFDRLVDRLMRKVAAERPATAEQVTQLLQSCVAHVRSPAAEALPAELRAPRASAWRFAAAVTLSVAMTAILVAGALRWQAPQKIQPGSGGDTIAQHSAAESPDAVPIAPVAASELPPLSPSFSFDAVDRQIQQMQIELQQLHSVISDDLGTSSDKDFSDE